MTSFNPQDAMLGLGAAGGILWAVYERWTRLKVETASYSAQVAGLDGQETVYSMLKDRLEALERELQTVRSEIAVERAHSRKLEIHIFKLESLMRKAGLEPPTFEEH